MMGLPRHAFDQMPAAPGEMPAMLRFGDVQVVPTQGVDKHIATGGPIWPDFNQQLLARHCRDRLAVDRVARAVRHTRSFRRPAVWGGYLNPHFGHLIIEQLTRLPQSLRDRQGDPVLFTLPPAMGEDEIPTYVTDLLDWYGVPAKLRRFVTAPLVVEDLHVAAQGEMMGAVSPPGDYLDLLGLAMMRNDLPALRHALVYVGRPGFVVTGQGGHAGEGYLCASLARLGVTVIDPARLSVRQQMQVYAGAEVLVFSEGSAMLGRHVLGYLPQEIHILRRRPGRDLCHHQLGPRCARLVYHPVVGHRLGAEMPDGSHHHNLTAALFDLEALFATFAGLGVELSRGWDMDSYRRDMTRDALGWMEKCKTAPVQVLRNLDLLRAMGVDVDSPLDDIAQPH